MSIETLGRRIIHVTLPKCGSQWVRDVLCAPEFVAYGALPNSGISLSLNVLASPDLDIPEGSFAGPIYRMNRWEWLAWKRPGDRAIVVLRDPRDRLVSQIFSVLYSHVDNRFVTLQRDRLLKVEQLQQRIDSMIGSFGAILRCYVTWHDCNDEDVLWLRYEDLVDDQFEQFSRIIRWLGWEIPDAVVGSVVDRLSFEKRSGRARGETDVHSHYRKGVAGDWRNHFDRAHGEKWEALFPGVLASLGYEADADWWRALPERAGSEGSATGEGSAGASAARPAVERLKGRLAEREAEIARLQRVCSEQLGRIDLLRDELSRMKSGSSA